jgi:hypothetical protein
MFAVDHAATALIIKRRFPSVSMTPLLLSVQAMQLAWVASSSAGWRPQRHRTAAGPCRPALRRW